MSGPTSRGGNRNQPIDLALALELDLPSAANSDPSRQSSASPGSNMRPEKAAETDGRAGGGMSVDGGLQVPTTGISPSLTAARDLAGAAEVTSQITDALTAQDPSAIPLPGSNPVTPTTPIDVKLVNQQFSELINAIDGVSTAVKSSGKMQARQLIDLQADIKALAGILEGASTKSQIDPELVERLDQATEALTGAVSALNKIDPRLAKIIEELGKLSESLASIRFDDIIAGIEEISKQLENGPGINEDLITKIIEKIDASSSSATKLDETQLKALTDAIAKLEQAQESRMNQAAKLADKSNALLALLLDELKGLREQMEKSKPQPTPDEEKAPDDRKFTKKEDRDFLIDMLKAAEREGREKLDVARFLHELEARGFLTIEESVGEGKNKRLSEVSGTNFEIHYRDPHPLEKRAGEEDADFQKRQANHYVTVSNSAKELYSMKAWTWAPTLLTVALLGGAAVAVAVGGASLVTTAAVVAAPLYLSKMWMTKQIEQVRTRFDGVFKLPITQQAGSALSPEKMLLETLATYLHVQQLPEHIRWINWDPKGITQWRPDDVSTNDAYYATGPLIIAMKNTLKFWDNFKYNIPNMQSPDVIDPARISELRTNEFDRVLQDFKNDWIGPIKKSFLKIPFACERVAGWGATIGVIAGLGSTVTSGGLSWLLRAFF